MEERALLLRRNFIIYSLENSWTWKYGYFSEFIWVAASENTPADKNMVKFSKIVIQMNHA